MDSPVRHPTTVEMKSRIRPYTVKEPKPLGKSRYRVVAIRDMYVEESGAHERDQRSSRQSRAEVT
jgi:hypothetical protein